MFIDASHFCTSLKFESKKKLTKSTFTEIGSNRASKFLTTAKMADSDKHISLLCYGINYDCKKFDSSSPGLI